jgi:hypothetical protein
VNKIRISAIFLGATVLLAGNHSAAAEPFVEFLRALQKRGYGEQGLAYLDNIADRPDLPPDTKETLDLERSKCLRIAAGEAYDAQQRTARLAESKRLGEKFFYEHSMHPAAGSVLLVEGDESLARGEQRLALARSAREKDLQDRANQDARTALIEGRRRFETAAKRLKDRLDALPEPAKGPDQPDTRAVQQHEEFALPWIEARSKIALSEYFLAQTYSDPKDAERVQLLKQAGQAFDSIFQQYRGRQIGLLAHMWHGKTLEELGDAPEALEYYDEVLAAEPEGNETDPELAPFFGQAELFRLQLQAKTTQPMEVLKEGELWQQAHKKWRLTSPYQGIALEIVRARLKSIESFRLASERTKGLRECVVALNAIGKIDSEFRQAALLLRRDVITKMGTGAALSFQEALTLGDEAAAERNWSEADSFFRQSLELATKSNDSKGQETARKHLTEALYRRAVDQYSARNLEKTLALCGELVRDYPDSPLAQDASSVAIAAALAEYGDAAQQAKEAAQARLQRVVAYALNRWPNDPVADDGRMALAQAALLTSDYAAAEQNLAQVTSRSNRYPTALQILGQLRWKQYLAAKKSPDANQRANEIARLRTEAVGSLNAGLERQRAAWQSASEPMPPALFDTQLLLAELQLEGEQWADASSLLKPLVQVIRSSSPTTVDRSSQRTLVAAIRAWLNTSELTLATEAVELLVSLSHDEEQPNSVLVELAKLVGQEDRKAPTTQPLHDLQIRLIDALASRKALTIPQLMYLGDVCVQLDRNVEARDIYERLLSRVDKDESATASGRAAVTGVRSRFVRILRSEGKLDEAAAQVNALIKEHPSALEPLMEKGYILQSLAERDQRRLDECIAHWTDVRVRLGRSKTRPPEYYDVLYNTGLCLVRQARLTSNKEKALQAEQILKSTLTLTPNLSGREMVAKYEALLNQAAALRGTAASAQAGSNR